MNIPGNRKERVCENWRAGVFLFCLYFLLSVCHLSLFCISSYSFCLILVNTLNIIIQHVSKTKNNLCQFSFYFGLF